MTRGTIKIDVEPCPSPEYCEEARRLCVAVIASGSVGMRNGSVTLHFDDLGRVRQVERHVVFRIKADKDHDNHKERGDV